MDAVYDAIIVGAGPAGLTAGLYLGRAGLRTLILEKEMIGGELMNRDIIENFPGFPDGVLGPELGTKMVKQIKKFGAGIQLAEVRKVETEGSYKLIRTSRGEYLAKGLILAGGSRPKKLGIPGEEEFINKGVFYCATCDGPQFAGKVVTVAGGGDSGVTEALFLSRIVSQVFIIELLSFCTATKILLERALANPKIEIKCGAKIEAIHGDDHVKEIAIYDERTGQRSVMETQGVLVHIGIAPNTDYLRGTLALNEKGQILVNERMETEMQGVFAAGDVRQGSPWQISTAVGDGAIAAMSLKKYLESL